MTLPYDSCRLYFYLRDKACSAANGDEAPVEDGRLIVDFESEHGEPAALGLSEQQARDALELLCRSELVGRLPSDQAAGWMRAHPGIHDDVLYVQPLDDLTATTLLFGCS